MQWIEDIDLEIEIHLEHNLELEQGELPAELREHYSIIRAFQRSDFAKLFEGVHRATRTPVFIKVLSVSDVPEWKNLDLFIKQAGLLESIEHPNIPAFFDAFEVDAAKGTEFYLIQKYIPNSRSLEEIFEIHKPLSLRASLAIYLQLLEVLDYLHGFLPPIIHRDIKPSNILIDEVGRLHLIDFDLATATANENRGSTIAGTIGYMPPEQLLGQAFQASDIYASTILFLQLASGVHPSQFPLNGLEIDLASLLPTALQEKYSLFERCLLLDHRVREKSAIRIISELKSVFLAYDLPISETIRKKKQASHQRILEADDGERRRKWYAEGKKGGLYSEFYYNRPIMPIAQSMQHLPPLNVPRTELTFTVEVSKESNASSFVVVLVIMGIYSVYLVHTVTKNGFETENNYLLSYIVAALILAVISFFTMRFITIRHPEKLNTLLFAEGQHHRALVEILTNWRVNMATIDALNLGTLHALHDIHANIQTVYFSHLVDGVSYHCKQVFKEKMRRKEKDGKGTLLSIINPLADGLSKDDKIAILYNPKSPREAIIFPGPIEEEVTDFSHWDKEE